MATNLTLPQIPGLPNTTPTSGAMVTQPLELPTLPQLPTKQVVVGSPKTGVNAYDSMNTGKNMINQGIQQQAAAKAQMTTTPEQTMKAMGYTPPKPEDLAKDAASQVLKTLGETPTQAPTPEQQTQDQFQLQQQQVMEQQTQAYTDYQNQITQIQNGTHPLTTAEQAQVSSMTAMFEQMKQDQIKANEKFQGGVKASNVARGLSELAQYDAEGRMTTAVNDGLAKVREIDNQMTDSVAKLTQAFRNDDIAMAKKSYDDYTALLDKRAESIKAIHDSAIDFQKTQADAKKQALADEQAQMEVQSANNLALIQNQLMSPDLDSAQKQALVNEMIMSGNLTPKDKLLLNKFQQDTATKYTKDINDFLSTQNLVLNPLTGGISPILPKPRAGAATTTGTTPTGQTTITGLTPEQSATVLGKGLSTIQAENVAGIYNGIRPPLSGFGVNSKEGMAVTAGLNALGYDLTKATQDWNAMQKRIGTMNGQQQVRLAQAITFTYDSLDIIEQLNNEWQAGGFPLLNKAQLVAAKNGALGADAMSLATRLDAQINDLVSELGTVYKGGNTSTDESLKLAAGNLSSTWSQKTLQDAIELARTNLQIRKNSIANSLNIEGNIYSPSSAVQAPDEIKNDIQSAINDKANFPNREVLIEALVEHYGLTPGEAGAYVYAQWTDSTKR